MVSINTRQEFIEYIMKTLGHPIVTVNVTEDQVNYRIDDALLKFFEFHNEGTYRKLIIQKLTQNDVDTGTVVLPPKVASVLSIYPHEGLFSAEQKNNFAITSFMQKVASSAWGGTANLGGGMFASYGGNAYSFSDAILGSSYLKTLSVSTQSNQEFEYSRYDSKLRILDNKIGLKKDEYIGALVYMEVDEDNVPVWNDLWLREYTTALVMRQWGHNLVKFGGVQLANGTTINGESILRNAEEQLRKLDEDLLNRWSEPLGVIVG